MVKRNVQVWLLLMAAVLVFLWFASARTAYASGGGLGTESFWPGEGGGLTHAVEGFIYHESGGPACGIWVFLETGYLTPLATTTDSEGFYKFEDPNEILPNSFYHIAVNGQWAQLGVECINKGYGQWYGAIQTDDKGLAWKSITLEHSAIVNVTAAALFSNTQFATLYYGTESNYKVEHSLSFTVPVLGIGTGYTTSMSITYTALFWTAPSYSELILRPYYAPTYFDDILGKVVSSGITQPLPNKDWGSDLTHEYVDPQNPPTPEYVDFPVAPGGKEWKYQESGSYTWKASVVPFGIIFEAFGQMISIDATVTVTQGKTTWVRYRIDNPTGNTINFRVYTPGATPDEQGQIGGMELHVWDMSGAG